VPSRPREGAALYANAKLGTQLIALSDGVAGTRETVMLMQQVANADSATPEVRRTAEKIVFGVSDRDWAGESRAIERWVKAHMRYTRDGLRVETLKTPLRMLREISTDDRSCMDCDDAATLIAALLLSVGHAPAFEVLGRGAVPHHVRVLDRSTDLILDPTVGEVSPGGQFGFREVFDVVPAAGLSGLGQEEPEKSTLERWLPLVLVGRIAFKFLRRRK
jgi:hypothetical protein